MKNTIFKLGGLLLLPLLLMSLSVHDFYTSMTKVDYNMASQTVQFSTKLDVEHLENALGKKYGSNDFESALESYIQSHIKVKVNESSKSFTFANSKVTGEVIWVYYNIPNVGDVKSIEIDNTLLFEKYPEQQNFVNFNINGKRESLIAKKGASSAVKTF